MKSGLNASSNFQQSCRKYKSGRHHSGKIRFWSKNDFIFRLQVVFMLSKKLFRELTPFLSNENCRLTEEEIILSA